MPSIVLLQERYRVLRSYPAHHRAADQTRAAEIRVIEIPARQFSYGVQAINNSSDWVAIARGARRTCGNRERFSVMDGFRCQPHAICKNVAAQHSLLHVSLPNIDSFHIKEPRQCAG